MPLQQRTTDYHCHILPGIDDGAVDEAASIAMARLLFNAGYREVYCTPHLIRGMYDATHAEILRLRDLLQVALNRQAIGIRLFVGREYYLDEFLTGLLNDPQPLEGTRIIMIEIPSHVSVDLVKETLYTVRRKGYTPMIAHPERCRLLDMETLPSERAGILRFLPFADNNKRDSEVNTNSLLTYLRQLGCYFQANLGSMNGQYGRQVRGSARYLHNSGIYTHAGTDAHTPESVKEILGFN